MQAVIKHSFWIWVATGVFVLLFFFQPTDLTASDLGRHVMNGKELLAGHWGVLTTNYYSYTTPDFHFVNHHWLFGVASYVLYKIGGFGILTIFFALLYALAPMVISVWWLPKSRGKWLLAAIAILIALPMLHSRQETRPEAVSSIFLALSPFFWRWWLEAKTKRRLLTVGAAFAAVMIVWVNTHIFWIFAPLVGGGYLVEALLVKDWQRVRRVFLLGFVLLVMCLITPVGADILLYPTGIFTNYAYPVAENQTLLFFLQYYPGPSWVFQTIFIVVLGILLGLFWRQVPTSLRPLLYGCAFLLLSNILMVRIASFSGLLIIPLIMWLLWMAWKEARFLQRKYGLTRQSPIVALASSVSIAIIIFILAATPLYNPLDTPMGIGLSPGVEAAADILRDPALANKVIFNDYDIGGYLIWHQLHPNYVYFDNRPEAYPQEFVEGEAIKAQMNDAFWEEVVTKRNIELIVFNVNDQTDWAQPFLLRRVQDGKWATVFIDQYAIILLKVTPENHPFIEEHRVPLDKVIHSR